MRIKSLFAWLIILPALSLLNGCRMQKTEPYTPDWRAGPPVLVYKTKKDYQYNVPVILSDDRTIVVSYPHPADLRNMNAELEIPLKLAKGYLMDNRGINERVAFLSLTYEEYAKLKKTPSRDSLRHLVVDDNPLTELCNCGNKDYLIHPLPQLNGIILKNKLDSTCQRIK